MKPTHIIQKFRSQRVETLFRADSGAMIAQRQVNVIKRGDFLEQLTSQMFVSEDKAAAFLRKLADEDARELHSPTGAAVIEEIDGEPLVSVAPGPMPKDLVRN